MKVLIAFCLVFGLTLSSWAAEVVVIHDKVVKARDDDEGLVVLFEKSQGSYYLRRDSASYEKFRKKLTESLQGKKPVSVTADSAQLNILEVK